MPPRLKVRQPLAKVEVILADTKHQAWLEEHAAVIEEELNVKQLEFCDDPSLYVEHEVVPNFKLLGPKLGKLLPKVKQWLGQQTGADLLANIRDNGLIDLTIDGQAIALTREEVEVRIKPRPGWTSANDQGVVVVLSTELTQELIDEGVANDSSGPSKIAAKTPVANTPIESKSASSPNRPTCARPSSSSAIIS